MIINLFDSAFAHNLAGLGSSVHGKTATKIQYVRNRVSWHGVTLLTDDLLCNSNALQVLESKVTIGWLLECREYRPRNYVIAESLLDDLDLLLTHDAALLEKYPQKCRFVPFGGCWIQSENIGMHPKTKQVSMIYSGKVFMPGHRIRHQIAQNGSYHEIGFYGTGSEHPIKFKEEGLLKYRFSIAVENSRAPNYFTEKLLDCFATGTIPIYWGCPNIDRWFNPEGIIAFDSPADIPLILEGLNYERMLPATRDNLERMREFEITDDWIADHILGEFA